MSLCQRKWLLKWLLETKCLDQGTQGLGATFGDRRVTLVTKNEGLQDPYKRWCYAQISHTLIFFLVHFSHSLFYLQVVPTSFIPSFLLAFFDWPLFCYSLSSVDMPFGPLFLLSNHLRLLLLLWGMGLPSVVGKGRQAVPNHYYDTLYPDIYIYIYIYR